MIRSGRLRTIDVIVSVTEVQCIDERISSALQWGVQ